MPSEPQQWINLDDFSPGLRHIIPPPKRAALGIADPAQTYDCIALPDGGLAPLPKLTNTVTRAAPGTATDSTFRISGFHVTGPVQAARYTSDYAGLDNVEVHLAYEWLDGSTHKWWWERRRVWESAPTTETIRDFTVTHDGSWAVGDQNYRPSAFVDHRLHPSDATLLGDIFVVVGWSPDDMQATANVWDIFPDPDAPTTLSRESILDTNEITHLISHQGRVVTSDRHVFQHGNAGYWITNDQFLYTNVNLRTFTGTSYVFSQGRISGFGAFGSVSAQELIAIKHRGGAMTISGDLDDPTVYSLPGVVSTDGAVTYGIYTPIGFIYAVRKGGVYAWGGGDSSDKISEYLNDNFYDIKPADWFDFYGKFEVWKEFILTPNNFVYDTKTKSWWRLAPTTPVFQWQVSPWNDYAYGAPASFAASGAIYYMWDWDTKVNTFRWQSHFLGPTIDRRIKVREVTIRAKVETTASDGTVAVTLINQAGDTKVLTFTVDNSDIPKLYRKDVGFEAQGLKVRVDSTGGGAGADVAPTVLEVNIGYDEIQRIGAS